MKPKVSFILPVYKREFVKEALYSVVHQTMPEIELIVVQDNPTWNLSALGFPCIKTIKHEKNMGIAKSYNDALDMTTGEIICPMNDDDTIIPERADITYNYFQRNLDIDIFYGTQYVTNKDMAIRAISGIVPFNKEIMMKRNIIPHCASAYRREVIKNNRYREDFKIANDWVFFLTAMKGGFKFGSTTTPLLYHRIHGNNAGRGFFAEGNVKNERKRISEEFGTQEHFEYTKMYVQ